MSQAIAAALATRFGGLAFMPLTDVLAELEAATCWLVLDNVEAVAPAVADLATMMLAACPGLRLLVTSREPLHHPAETVWPVAMLSLPPAVACVEADAPLEDGAPDDTDEIDQSDAVGMLLACVSALQRDFSPTDEDLAVAAAVCRRLDGWPLAIEMVASRARVLSLQQTAAWLENLSRLPDEADQPPVVARRSVRNALDWSYARLSPHNQHLFRILAVFQGGASFEALQTVCASSDVGMFDVVDGLSVLSDYSLLRVDNHPSGARYRLPHLSRLYAAELLAASGEADAMRAAHAAAFAQIAEGTGLTDPAAPVDWVCRLDADRDNFRAALGWAMETQRIDLALRLSSALWRFWELRGAISEGRRYLDAILARAGDARASLRVPALDGAATLAADEGDEERAEALHQASLALKRQLGDERRVPFSLSALATLAADRTDFPRALGLCDEAVALSRRLRDRDSLARSLLAASMVRRAQGTYREAAVLLDESLALFRGLGDVHGLAWAMSRRGDVARLLSRYVEAEVYDTEALALRRQTGDRIGLAFSLMGLGALARDRGDFDQSTALLTESLALFRELGHSRGIARALLALALDATYRGDLAPAAMHSAEALSMAEHLDLPGFAAGALYRQALVAMRGDDDRRALALLRKSLSLRRESDHSHGIADAVDLAAALAARQGRLETAAELDGAAAALREASGAPRSLAQDSLLRTYLAPATEVLDRDQYEAARVRGRGQPIDLVIASVLSDQPLPTLGAPVVSLSLGLDAASPVVMPTLDEGVGLRICALGQSKMYRDGRLLANTDWTYAKPRELLFLLLSNTARTKEQIGVALWPEASPGQLRAALHPALYHLRRVLGSREWVTSDHDSYAFNRKLAYWYDVDVFEANVAKAEQLAETSPLAAIEGLEAAVAVYQGDFLADVSATNDWLLTRRAELRHTFLEALMLLARLSYAQQRYPEAADAYRRAIAQDSYLEGAHRGLMRSYEQMGELNLALKHYQTLVVYLRAEMNTTPAPKTTALYEKMAHGNVSIPSGK